MVAIVGERDHELHLMHAATHLLRIGCLAVFALPLLIGCAKDDEFTPEQKLCVAQIYAKYDPSRMEECVDACKKCKGGNNVTCTTSCKLRGAKPAS